MRIVRMPSIEQVKEQIPWALSIMRLIGVKRTRPNLSDQLAYTLVRNLNGEFDETGMELRPEFRKDKSSEDDEVTIHAIEIDD